MACIRAAQPIQSTWLVAKSSRFQPKTTKEQAFKSRFCCTKTRGLLFHNQSLKGTKTSPFYISHRSNPILAQIGSSSSLSPNDIETMKVIELKSELKLRGLPTSGRKSVLVERLLGEFNIREDSDSDAEDDPDSASQPSDEKPITDPSRTPSNEIQSFATEESEESINVEDDVFPGSDEEDIDEPRMSSEEESDAERQMQKCVANLQRAQHRMLKGAFDNVTGMELLFLGTSSGSPSVKRNVTSLLVRLEKSIWMVDCGEATQHQIIRSPIRASKIEKIFITHMHGDHCMGLPGLLAHITHNREEEKVNNDMPLEIYGPPGIFELVETSLSLTQTHIHKIRVLIHELAYDTEGSGKMRSPLRESRRWKNLYHQYIYPRGGNAAPQRLSLQRRRTRGVVGGMEGEGMWPISRDGDFTVVAAHLDHRAECFGYVVMEADQPGHIDAEKCTALGLPPGREYKALKDGQPVTTKHGNVIRPQDVIGPEVPGRKLVLLGDNCNADMIGPAARRADVVVHEATFHDKMAPLALKAGHSTAKQAGRFANRIQAKNLVITHFSARYDVPGGGHRGGPGIQDLVEEAKQSFGSENVHAARDFYRLPVPRREP